MGGEPVFDKATGVDAVEEKGSELPGDEGEGEVGGGVGEVGCYEGEELVGEVEEGEAGED